MVLTCYPVIFVFPLIICQFEKFVFSNGIFENFTWLYMILKILVLILWSFSKLDIPHVILSTFNPTSL